MFTSVRERRRSGTARAPYEYGARRSRTGLAIWDLPYSTARPRTDLAVRVRRDAVLERRYFCLGRLPIVSFAVTAVGIKSFSRALSSLMLFATLGEVVIIVVVGVQSAIINSVVLFPSVRAKSYEELSKDRNSRIRTGIVR